MERLIDISVLVIVLVASGMFYESLDFDIDTEEDGLALTNSHSEVDTKPSYVHYYIIGGIVVLGLA